jgi:hypothetical protein
MDDLPCGGMLVTQLNLYKNSANWFSKKWVHGSGLAWKAFADDTSLAAPDDGERARIE